LPHSPLRLTHNDYIPLRLPRLHSVSPRNDGWMVFLNFFNELPNIYSNDTKKKRLIKNIRIISNIRIIRAIDTIMFVNYGRLFGEDEVEAS
jgi:hypothetical protein